MSHPLITVICTAKNADRTIGPTLRSVQAQTLARWEMVVIDDGSTDATAQLVREFSDADPRFRLVLTDGVGRARALNMGLEEAATPLVANIDADDLFDRDHLCTMLDLYEKQSEFMTICTTVHFISDEQSYSAPSPNHTAGPEQLKDITPQLLVRNPVCHSSVIMDRLKVLEIGGYNEQIRSQFDWELWIRIAQHGYKIGELPLPLVAKRIHENQSFEAGRRLKYVLYSLQFQARAIRSLDGRWYHWIIMGCRLLWGLVPRRFAFWLREKRRVLKGGT